MSFSRRQLFQLTLGILAAGTTAEQTLARQSRFDAGRAADRSRVHPTSAPGDPVDTDVPHPSLERMAAPTKRVPALDGVQGRIRFETEDGKTAYLLRIDHGEVDLTTGDEEAQAVLVCDSTALIARVLRGEANLIVETLQGHTRERGDLTLILKAVLGLQAGSPFADSATLSLDTPR